MERNDIEDAAAKACGACRNLEAYWEDKRRREQERLRDELLHASGGDSDQDSVDGAADRRERGTQPGAGGSDAERPRSPRRSSQPL